MSFVAVCRWFGTSRFVGEQCVAARTLTISGEQKRQEQIFCCAFLHSLCHSRPLKSVCGESQPSNQPHQAANHTQRGECTLILPIILCSGYCVVLPSWTSDSSLPHSKLSSTTRYHIASQCLSRRHHRTWT